jgi:predicted outer membrane protein
MAVVTNRWSVLTVVVAVAASLPAHAASKTTAAFLANAVPNLDFLDRASRLALTVTKSRSLRAFARDMAREQTLAANAVFDWTQAAESPMVASVSAGAKTSTQTPGPDAAREDLDTSATGSVRIDGAKRIPKTLDPAQDDRLPRGQEDLDSLEGLDGRAFDTEYKDKMSDALRQLEADYTDFLAAGDTAALQVIAARELPIVQRRLAQLGKL